MQQEQPTVVLIAMEAEADALRKRMTDVREQTEHGVRVSRGALAGRPVTAVLCGIGKVAAATAATALAISEQPRVLLSVGVAGGVSEDLSPGALVVIAGAVEHDYDLRPFLAEPSLGIHGPRVWPAAAEPVAALLHAAGRTGTPTIEAWTASGDHVVIDRGRHDFIRGLGAAVKCVDMETSAVAYAAVSQGVPWAGLRFISDGADEHLDPDPVMAAALDSGTLLTDVLEHYLAAL